MKHLILILMVIASLTIANAGEGKRYVVQPGAPVATSVEALRKGEDCNYKIVYAVKVKGTPPDVLSFSENYDRRGRSITFSTNTGRRNLDARLKR